MKIVFICTKSITFNTFLSSQAKYFLDCGHKVKVACSDIKNLNFKKDSCEKINFPMKSRDFFNIANYYRIFLEIKKIIKNNKSSIFYLHTPTASYLFRLFSIFSNVKIVYFVHGFRFTHKTNFFKSLFFKTIENILSIKTKIFITINNEDFFYVKKNMLSKSKVYKINGVGLNKSKIKKKILKNKQGIRKILVISAYKKSKGYYELIKIAEHLQNYEIIIECFGYGNSKKFQHIIKKKKLRNIILNKFDINLKKRIKNYDLLLHLSSREGLPVSLMECLSEGLPIICKNIRGNNDLINDKFNGFFIKSPKDAVYKIFFLNIEAQIFNKMRNNALNSINEQFFQQIINGQVHKILKKA